MSIKPVASDPAAADRDGRRTGGSLALPPPGGHTFVTDPAQTRAPRLDTLSAGRRPGAPELREEGRLAGF
jgi:hypothetical protein